MFECEMRVDDLYWSITLVCFWVNLQLSPKSSLIPLWISSPAHIWSSVELFCVSVVCRASRSQYTHVSLWVEYMTARECGVMLGYSLVLMLKQHSRLPPRVPWLLICCCLHLIFTIMLRCTNSVTTRQPNSVEEWLFYVFYVSCDSIFGVIISLTVVFIMEK